MDISFPKPLVGKKAKIIVGQSMTSGPMFMWLVTAYALFQLVDKLEIAKKVSAGVFVILMFVVIFTPLLLRILYLMWMKMGYVIFHDNSLDLCTKFTKKNIAYGTEIRTKVVAHHIGAKGIKADYYSIKIIFEQNGKKKQVHMYTDNLNYFEDVVNKFVEKA